MKDSRPASERPRTAKQVVGQAGEDQALEYLRRQGLTLVERNFRCKGGEIDLIMRATDTLVFVEVRKRADRRYGGAAASVTGAKQVRMRIAAQTYLQGLRVQPACRLDVIAIDGLELNWLQNAFEA